MLAASYKPRIPQLSSFLMAGGISWGRKGCLYSTQPGEAALLVGGSQQWSQLHFPSCNQKWHMECKNTAGLTLQVDGAEGGGVEGVLPTGLFSEVLRVAHASILLLGPSSLQFKAFKCCVCVCVCVCLCVTLGTLAYRPSSQIFLSQTFPSLWMAQTYSYQRSRFSLTQYFKSTEVLIKGFLHG